MKTAWVLIILLGNGMGGGYTAQVIPGIVSKEACEQTAKSLAKAVGVYSCVEVQRP